jgi:capsular polysaccharide transport system permease protein
MEPPSVDTPEIESIDHSVATAPRAELISKSLRSVARRARTPRSVLVSSGVVAQRRWEHVFVWAILAAFGFIVVVPNLVAGVYLAFFASDQYASEARFAVRGAQPNPLDPLGSIMGMAQYVQDSLILTDYIDGPSMVTAIDHSLNLRRMFSRDDVDILSRLNPEDSQEQLISYWRRHVDVSISASSGIITVVVRAFTPQDSLAIANDIVSLSEKLVNDLTERSRQDALRQARAELGRANQNLQEKTTAMRNLRNTAGVLDTVTTSQVMTQMQGDLRLQLIQLQQEYDAQRHTIEPTAPQLRVLAARIDSMKQAMRDLQARMTDSNGSSGRALSDSMGRFEKLELEKDIAEKQYAAAAAAFEQARVDLETQNIYLATFLHPVLAQEALYPRRLWLWSIVTVLSLLLWGLGAGIAVLVRNHVAS